MREIGLPLKLCIMIILLILSDNVQLLWTPLMFTGVVLINIMSVSWAVTGL